jgi:hypothetical protein
VWWTQNMLENSLTYFSWTDRFQFPLWPQTEARRQGIKWKRCYSTTYLSTHKTDWDINLIKNVQDLYEENIKLQLKKSKKKKTTTYLESYSMHMVRKTQCSSNLTFNVIPICSVHSSCQNRIS